MQREAEEEASSSWALQVGSATIIGTTMSGANKMVKEGEATAVTKAPEASTTTVFAWLRSQGLSQGSVRGRDMN